MGGALHQDNQWFTNAQKTTYNLPMQMLARKLLIAAVWLGLMSPLAGLASQHAKTLHSDKSGHAKVATNVAKPNKKSTDRHLARTVSSSKSSKTRLASSKKELLSKSSKSKLASTKSHQSAQVKRHSHVADATSASEAVSNNATNQSNFQVLTSSATNVPKLPTANVAAIALATASSPEATQMPVPAVAPVQLDDQDISWSSSVQEVLIKAISLTGIKYKFGGISPDTGFDCSGFVRYVFMQALNLNLPHGARAISQLGQSVAVNDLKPGDLVFFNTLKSTFSHVGIYVGNNRFIHSPSAGGGVSIVDMGDEYWSKRFNGARRIQSPQASNP